MGKDAKSARSRGEIVPRDFATAVKDVKLAILRSRARAAHASNVDAIHDQDVDERVLSKSLVANVEKTIQALGGDDFCFWG